MSCPYESFVLYLLWTVLFLDFFDDNKDISID